MKLNKNMRVLNISHLDMDGCAAQIVVGNYFQTVDYRMCTFTNVDRALQNTPYENYDLVLVTDLYPNDIASIVCPKKTVILDHHDSAKRLHAPSRNRYVVTEHCGAWLAKEFIEFHGNVKLSWLNNLLYLVNDYDLWLLNNPKSKFLNELYGRYKEVRFRRRFFEGKTRFTEEEISFLRGRIKEYQRLWDNLEIYELSKARGCLITASEFINDLADDLIRKQGYKMVLMYNPRSDHISVRHKIEGLHIGHFLQKLSLGGGHEHAGGLADNPGDTITDKKELVHILEEAVVHDFPEARR